MYHHYDCASLIWRYRSSIVSVCYIARHGCLFVSRAAVRWPVGTLLVERESTSGVRLGVSTCFSDPIVMVRMNMYFQ